MPMATAPDRPIRPSLLLADRSPLPAARAAIEDLYLADETDCVEALLPLAQLDPDATQRVTRRARGLVEAVRRAAKDSTSIDAFMQQYDLSSQEGVVLMCLAEALLRIPDAETADRLIQDKLSDADFAAHLGESSSWFVNASTWGLMLTGRIVQAPEDGPGFMRRLVQRAGEPVIRTAMRQAMGIMGHQFIMGRDIAAAIKVANKGDNRAYRYSFDMLGEAALTTADAARYQSAYLSGIDAIAAGRIDGADVFAQPSISVKLSALHPRYEYTQCERVLAELAPKVLELAERAKSLGVGLTVDAEEADRLDLSLALFERVYRTPTLNDWEGFGLALQSYQKRMPRVVDWLVALAAEVGRRIPVRLVKGAYWDSEIKHAQQDGLSGYPVFTRKASTDVAYLACASKLIAGGDAVYAQFATHNAHTLANIVERMGDRRDFEFQRLHGMGEELYAEVVPADKLGIACRVYAPVGSHEDLLPYLVRRLLENGANTSFVNRIVDERVSVDEIVTDPVAEVAALEVKPHPRIVLPAQIYGGQRVNSTGFNFADHGAVLALADAMEAHIARGWSGGPIIGGEVLGGEARPVFDPSDHRRQVGEIVHSDDQVVDRALELALHAQAGWDRTPAAERCEILCRAADLFESNGAELMALCVREAGKSVPDAMAELREAVDFLRYYGQCALQDFGAPIQLPGPTGERNQISLHGRGTFLCISPWNFPLAIFTGQVAAALAAGNAVLAKPAEPTGLVAFRAVQLLLEAGVPPQVLSFIPGKGSRLGAHAISDPSVAGVAFTGSTGVARIINRQLAARDAPIASLIAETGGQNCMIVDSSALPEQVVLDVVRSSFNSAGQRCSALRVLFLQDDIADRTMDLLAGHMQELVVGDPALLSTDVGPVIDQGALDGLEAHAQHISEAGRVIHRIPLPEPCAHGTYCAPLAVEIDSLARLTDEQFGPILHVVRYRARDLDQVVGSINATGFGLTLGVHSRIESVCDRIRNLARVGNCYVNRDMVGAVVGVQPFGGQGLSGTGPKAGGPHYLHRFATEKTYTVNTAAVGGNASLLSLDED
jgi:RHH-type transcriptional regulator, proline utilization regulon repressor / proline dehydrogenase / delta 1-pyrroline-5-carboxylate dehydrogenase